MIERFRNWLRARFLSYVDEQLPYPTKYLEQPSGMSMATFVDPQKRIIGYTFIVPWDLSYTYDPDEYDTAVLEEEPETIADNANWLEVIARLSEPVPKELLN